MRREEIEATAAAMEHEAKATGEAARESAETRVYERLFGHREGLLEAARMLREALAKSTPATFCSQCGHFAHVAGSCNHGYSPCPTVAFPDGMREDAAGSGCVCGLYREGACERVKS